MPRRKKRSYEQALKIDRERKRQKHDNFSEDQRLQLRERSTVQKRKSRAKWASEEERNEWRKHHAAKARAYRAKLPEERRILLRQYNAAKAREYRQYRVKLPDEKLILRRHEDALVTLERNREKSRRLFHNGQEYTKGLTKNPVELEHSKEITFLQDERDTVKNTAEKKCTGEKLVPNIHQDENDNDNRETLLQIKRLQISVLALKNASLEIIRNGVKSIVDHLKGRKGLSNHVQKAVKNSSTVKNVSVLFKRRKQETNTSTTVFPTPFRIDSRIFVCIVCDEEFGKQVGAATHLIRHTESELSEALEKYNATLGANTSENETRYLCVTCYKCEVCAEKFHGTMKYRNHVVEKHKENREFLGKSCFPCSLCDEAFILRNKLMSHLQVFHDIFTQCPICYENIENQELFYKHLNETHPEESKKGDNIVEYEEGYCCKECGFCSRSHHRVSLHIKEDHRQKKSLPCEYCKLEYDSKKSLFRHKRQVHLVKLYCCEICGHRFSNENKMKRHKREHKSRSSLESQEKVECKQCLKTFSNKSTYKIHFMALHQGKRAFQCTICEKTFTNPAALHQHKITVCEKEKAVKKTCPICGKSVDNYLLLLHHKTNIHKHGNSEENVCHVCNKTFRDSFGLYTHNNLHHTNRDLKCAVCNKSYRHKNGLLGHWRKHGEGTPYKCSVCLEPFKDRHQFYQHKKTKHKNEMETVEIIVDSEVSKKVKEDFNKAHASQFSKKVFTLDYNLESTVASSKTQYNTCVKAATTVQIDGCAISTGTVQTNKDVLTCDNIKEKLFYEAKNNNTDADYTDFSRSNVPVFEIHPAVKENPSDICEPGGTNVVFNNNNKNIGKGTIIENAQCEKMFELDNDFFNFEEPSSPMEYPDRFASLEDKKPFISESHRSGHGDPFHKKLIVEIERLKECLLCDQVFITSDLLALHMRSKGHRAAIRANKRESILITKKEKKMKFKKNILVAKSKKRMKSKSKSVNSKRSHRKEKQKGEIFPCPICDEQFSTFRDYKIHRSSHRKTVKCLLCTKTFPTVRKLVSHYISEHDGQKIIKCTICGLGFLEYQMQNIRDHMRYTHATEKRKTVKIWKTPPCDICGERFTKEKMLRDHLLSHNDDKHNCTRCEGEFKSFVELESHYNEKHNGEMPYPCGECTQKFSTQIRRQQHQKKHHSQEKYLRDTVDGTLVCDICGEKFTREYRLKRHKATHIPMEERTKFFCEFCGKSFLNKASMASHVRGHTGEKPYQCTVCEVAFVSVPHLKVHMESVHSGISHLCDICGKSFGRYVNLHEHRKIHTSTIVLTCSQCSKTFPSTKKLNRHLKRHAEKIEKIKTGYIRKELPFPCHLCQETFSKPDTLMRHLNQLHDPTRPFGCDQCSCRFNHKSNLNLHIKGVHKK